MMHDRGELHYEIAISETNATLMKMQFEGHPESSPVQSSPIHTHARTDEKIDEVSEGS